MTCVYIYSVCLGWKIYTEIHYKNGTTSIYIYKDRINLNFVILLLFVCIIFLYQALYTYSCCGNWFSLLSLSLSLCSRSLTFEVIWRKEVVINSESTSDNLDLNFPRIRTAQGMSDNPYNPTYLPLSITSILHNQLYITSTLSLSVCVCLRSIHGCSLCLSILFMYACSVISDSSLLTHTNTPAPTIHTPLPHPLQPIW